MHDVFLGVGDSEDSILYRMDYNGIMVHLVLYQLQLRLTPKARDDRSRSEMSQY